MAEEDFPGFGEVEAGDGGFDGLNDIASAGVGDDLVGLRAAAVVEGGYGGGGEVWDAAVELVFEFSAGVGEADFLAVGGDVVGVEVVKFPAGCGRLLPGKDGGGGSVAEQAE